MHTLELRTETQYCRNGSDYYIVMTILTGQGGFFVLDAPGGTGKTFLISLFLAEIRSNNGIALAVASAGIAATLLDSDIQHLSSN